MNGRIERRVSPITGRVTYRCRVYLGKRDGGPRWISGGSYGRLHAHGDEPCAEAALEALLKKLAAPPSSATDETAAELLERWMRDAVRPDKRANTVMAHEQAIRIHIAPRLGSILARELTPADVATWQAAQIAAGFSAKSVRNFRGTLSACYHWALRLGLVTSNPVAAVPPPRLPERHVEAVAVADAHVYLAALRDTRLWPALMLAATTGMRRGEVLALRWRDVDLATRRVTIARQFVGRTQATLEAGPLKTAAGRRTITLPQAAVDALAELRAERLAQIPAGSEWDEGALICCGRRGQPIVPDRLTSELNLRLRRRGLAPLSIHAFRHMVATVMLRSGVPVKVVSEHLGHAQVTTTLAVYDHVNQADEDAAVMRLQGAWEEAAEQVEGSALAHSEPKRASVDELAARRACK